MQKNKRVVCSSITHTVLLHAFSTACLFIFSVAILSFVESLLCRYQKAAWDAYRFSGGIVHTQLSLILWQYRLVQANCL